jgi:hypothetical protein
MAKKALTKGSVTRNIRQYEFTNRKLKREEVTRRKRIATSNDFILLKNIDIGDIESALSKLKVRCLYYCC